MTRTDQQPLVYLEKMKVVDSRIAGKIEDLSYFDHIEYTSGDLNELTDLMSRTPGSECMNKTEVNEVGYLPEGLVVETKDNIYKKRDSEKE